MLQLVRVMRVPKKYKMIVKNEISNEVFYNASVFETKFSQRVRFSVKCFFESQFCTKVCIQKNQVLTEFSPCKKTDAFFKFL